MDRLIVYPGAIPLDSDILNVQRNVMAALGLLAQATLGATTVADGLACAPTSPASMTVTVGPGSITALAAVDGAAFGSLGTNSAPLVKQGINLASTSFTLAAPATSGQSVNYLVEAAFAETDGGATVLPYYNAANPAQPYSGPNGSGTAQNTARTQTVALQLKAGAAATAGSQTTPAADIGYVPLYVITVSYGQSTVTAANIAAASGAPFLPFKLPQLAPGFSRVQVFTSSTTWTVPLGVTKAKVRLVGGGGGGGGCTPSGSTFVAASGGGAGGYSEGIFAVTPGQSIAVTVGAGGIAGIANNGQGGTGGTSSCGSLCSATGGAGGYWNSSQSSPGGAGGAGTGGAVNIPGGYGGDGQAGTSYFAGNGGASAFGGGGRGGIANGIAGQAPGSGGGGCYSTTGAGGAGAAGLVIVEY